MRTSRRMIGLLAGVVLAFSVASAPALEMNLGRVSGHHPAGSTIDEGRGGGEFTAVLRDTGANTGATHASVIANYHPNALVNRTIFGETVTGFQTFCVEVQEFIHLNTWYNVQINADATAIKGGTGSLGGDELRLGTAYLYQQFALGALAGYDYDPLAGRSESAQWLQQAIWYFENEITLSSPLDNPFVAHAEWFFGDLSTANSTVSAGAAPGYDYDFGVTVINVGGSPNWAAQDQLVFMGVSVPDAGATALLLGLALSGLFLVRRRRP